MLFQKYKDLKLVAFCAVAFLPLGGCAPDLSEPSWTSENRAQVKEHRFVEELAVADASEGFVVKTAQHYMKYGSGPVVLSVTYDPDLKGGRSIVASDFAAYLVSEFRARGVLNVNVDILPIKGSGYDDKVVVSYTSYTAHAPKDCGVLPGLEDTNIAYDREYKLGCSVETLLARQIARPKDLLGVGSVDPTTDGRRASNVVNVYRVGEPNDALEGESASE